MLIVEYDPGYGLPMNDASVPQYVTTLISRHRFTAGDLRASVSTETVIDEVRLRILKGEIDHLIVRIEYEGQLITVNEYGNLSDQMGIGALNDHRITEIVRLQSRKRLAKKKAKEEEASNGNEEA